MKLIYITVVLPLLSLICLLCLGGCASTMTPEDRWLWNDSTQEPGR